MPTIANLATMLTANAQNLDAGLKSAEDKLKAFDENLKKGIEAQRAAAEATKIAAAAAFGGASAAIQGWVKDSLAAADQLLGMARQADRVGLSVDEMAAVQKFAGAQAEEFTHALVHLNRTLGEVKAGSDEATQKLAEVGIDANKLMGLSEMDRVRALLDFFKALPSEIDKAAAAEAAFGKGGLEMIEVLSRGSERLDEVSAKMKQWYEDTFGLQNIDQIKQFRKELKEAQEQIEALETRAKIGTVTWLDRRLSDFKNLWGGITHGFDMQAQIADDIDRAVQRRREARERQKPPEITPDNPFYGTAAASDSIKTFSSSLEEIQRVSDAVATPFDKLTLQMQKLDVMFAEGAIEADVYRQSIVNLFNSLATLDEGPHKFAAAADIHGTAAYSAILKSDFGSRNESPDQRLERLLGQLKDANERTARNTQQMADALQRAGYIKKLEP